MFIHVMTSVAILGVGLISLKNPLFSRETDPCDVNNETSPLLVSVIIPARNEEQRLGHLLTTLNRQSVMPCEVIVVNDESTDSTPNIARDSGAFVVDIKGVPQSVAPKPYACDQGFAISRGDIVIFLDADTKVEADFIKKVVRYFSDERHHVLTVQPFHTTTSFWQLFSFFFHFVSILGSGLLSLLPFSHALFGPCVAMRRSTYIATGGWAHPSVASSVIEDVELGKILHDEKIHVGRFLGRGVIEYTMYSSFRQLWHGWTKNISRGATRTPFVVLFALILFLGALVSVPVSLANTHSQAELYVLAIELSVMVALLFNVARKAGTYFLAVCAYPLMLVVFFGVFAWSLLCLVTRRNVKWSERSLNLGDHP